MTPRILLLGGHGKVSLLMTPKIVSRSWNLTSVIRDPSQSADILAAGKDGPGKVDVLVESIEDVKSEGDAKAILEKSKADWVIWCAGAGGKGGPTRTNAIDREACIHFTRASLSLPSITKFLLVSALSSRREQAPWWDDESYAEVQKMNKDILPVYYKAKLAADETLTVLGEERKQSGKGGFEYIILRPGGLSDEKETGKVSLGKTKGYGMVTRGDVAETAVRLLEAEGASGWFDLLAGEEETGEAVKRVVKEGINSMEGEDLKVMRENME